MNRRDFALPPGQSIPRSHRRRATLPLLAVLLATALPRADFRPAPSPEREIAAAASGFLASLPAELLAKAHFAFDHAGRRSWAFVPGEREGVPLRDLPLPARRLVHDLLRAALSAEGYLKATAILDLESVLRVLEAGGAGPDRNSELYYLAIYGEPSPERSFGFRFEGHHLSLNVTLVEGKEIAVTPLFLGANPAEVRSGPKTGLRVLAREEDLGRELVTSLPLERRKIALLADAAPADIFLKPGAEGALSKPAGLAAEAMIAAERDRLRQLVEHYARTLRKELADAELRKIEAAGFGAVHFGWAGSLDRGRGHYYRIHGPTFAIEYDNTQNGANHIHTVWHDLQNDFGHDALRRHHHHDHGGK